MERWYIKKARKEYKDFHKVIHKKIIDARFKYYEDKGLNNFYSEYCAAQAAIGFKKGCSLEELSKRLRGNKLGYSLWHSEDEYFQNLAKDILMHLESTQDIKITIK